MAALVVDLGSSMFMACFAGDGAFLRSLRFLHHGRYGHGRARRRHLWHTVMVLLVMMHFLLCSLCSSAGPSCSASWYGPEGKLFSDQRIGPQTLH